MSRGNRERRYENIRRNASSHRVASLPASELFFSQKESSAGNKPGKPPVYLPSTAQKKCAEVNLVLQFNFRNRNEKMKNNVPTIVAGIATVTFLSACGGGNSTPRPLRKTWRRLRKLRQPLAPMEIRTRTASRSHRIITRASMPHQA